MRLMGMSVKNLSKNIWVMIKQRVYVAKHIKSCTCTEYDGFYAKREHRNVPIGLLIEWHIMHISNEAEPLWSNSSAINETKPVQDLRQFNILGMFEIEIAEEL